MPVNEATPGRGELKRRRAVAGQSGARPPHSKELNQGQAALWPNLQLSAFVSLNACERSDAGPRQAKAAPGRRRPKRRQAAALQGVESRPGGALAQPSAIGLC